jgi:hypothetical protein
MNSHPHPPGAAALHCAACTTSLPKAANLRVVIQLPQHPCGDRRWTFRPSADSSWGIDKAVADQGDLVQEGVR